jgi:transcriptional regulator with XRE-family HTH domain
MSQRRSTGSRVHAAREETGLSLRRAARRLGVSPRSLRGWEQGRADIPFAVRQSMVKLYGLVPETLIRPERRAAPELDGSVIRIGSVTFSANDTGDDALRAFLAAVRLERGLAPKAALSVRGSDAAVLAELLGGTAEDIVRNLQRLLGVDEHEAVEFGALIFRKTAIAGALAVGLAAGVVGSGTFSAHPPAASAVEITASDAASIAPAPVDPDWAEIGDAAVLWRDGVPHD